jgi:hypothetical protein
MRKILMILALSLVLVFGLALQASALIITGPAVGNYEVNNPLGPGNAFFEDYNAQELVRTFPDLGFISQDGFAVVDRDPATGQILFFDKTVVLNDPNDLQQNLNLTFHVFNGVKNGPGPQDDILGKFTWSDYHFFVLAQAPQITNANPANINPVISPDGFSVAYSFPANQLVDPGDTQTFVLSFDTSNLALGYSFNLRQVATAIPVPPSAFLLGSGLLGLGVLGWRRK